MSLYEFTMMQKVTRRLVPGVLCGAAVFLSSLGDSHVGFAQISPGLLMPTAESQPPVAPDPNVVTAGFADEVAAGGAAAKTELTTETIAQELAVVEAATDLSAELRDEIKERLQKASSWLDGEATSKKRQSEIEALLPRIPAKQSETRNRLNNFSDAEFQAMPTGNSVAELETQLSSLRELVAADENALRDKEKEIESRTATLTSLAKETAELEQRIATLRPQIQAAGTSDPAARAQQLEMRSRLRLREQELITNKLERKRLEESGELLPLQRDLAKRIWNNRQKMLSRWQTAVDDWRKEESKRQAEQARRIAENSHSALKSLAEENARIAETRMKTAAEIQRLTEQIKKLNELGKQLGDDFDELSDRVEHAGTTSTTGLLLRKKREELPPVTEFSERAAFVQTTMPDVHLQLSDWKRMRREVADPEEAAQTVLDSLDASLASYDQSLVLKVLNRLMTDRRDLLDKAIPDQNTYLQDLNELELVNQQVSEQTAEFRQYLNQRVLWIRSTDLISIADIRQAQDSLVTILSLSRWKETAMVAAGALLKRPAVALGLLAVVILLVLFRARLHATQKRLSEPPPAGTKARFSSYLAAFGISVLLSARWPALLLVIGYRLKIAANASSWTESVGNALITSVLFLWCCELIRELCRRDAVGERLFGWPAKATATVRNTLELTILVGTPLITLVQLTQFGEVDEMQSLQRVLFIAILALLGIQLARLTRPSGALMQCLSEASTPSIVFRSRHAIWLSVTGAPLAFAILSITGYHFSAYQLSGHLAQSAAALVAIIILYSLGLCWLNVVGYNRSIREAALAQQAKTEELSEASQSNEQIRLPDTSSHIDEGSPSVDASVQQLERLVEQNVQLEQQAAQAAAPGETPAEQAETIDTRFHSAADEQVRELLRYASILLMIVGGWFIWSEVLPALRVLDQVVLWQNIEKVAESFVDADGNDKIRIVDHSVPTTLTDLLVAVLMCVATLVIGRRIPGVLEVILLEHLPMENGARQAAGIIARYVATVAGLIIACNVIRVSWSSIQWLAAAMTVGLGFGLQEIFANLVSGLIILVERPIRVGDIVSVGEVTGTVSRMQMRATTVTDYDRRELIVPNKKFITDNVINWTLSDPISRVVLPVGVAYGTDVGRVREVLLRIAAECPHVLQEPPPNTLFKGFGESTLNCQLMVFIPQRKVYIEVVNELNAAIAREFGKADIEIAFPQLDLHVKGSAIIQDSVGKHVEKSAA